MKENALTSLLGFLPILLMANCNPTVVQKHASGSRQKRLKRPNDGRKKLTALFVRDSEVSEAADKLESRAPITTPVTPLEEETHKPLVEDEKSPALHPPLSVSKRVLIA